MRILWRSTSSAKKIFAVIGVILALLSLPVMTGRLIANFTNSAPKGLYWKSETGEFVTFCLAESHKTYPFYTRFCSPKNPNGTRILKYVAARTQIGDVMVLGLTEASIDSRVLGPIKPDQIKGHWRRIP